MDRNAARIRWISIATVVLGVFLTATDSSAQGLAFCDSNDLGCDACLAASGLPTSSRFGDCLCCRPQLTGDWHGLRDRWTDNGIRFDADTTHWYLGVASGGLEQEFRYAGRGDYVMNVDMGKLAGREGLFVKLRAEHRFGEPLSGATGALLPPNVAADLPVPDSEDIYLTNVLFTQALSESFAVFAGKLDTFDGDVNAFAHGRGKTQFSNIGLVTNPALLRIVPYSTLGTGFVILQEGEPLFTFTALNPTDTARTSGFDELFAEGVTLIGELRLPTQFFGKPGHQLFGGAWSSRDYVSLGQDPRIVLPDIPIARQSGSWAMYWNFDQYLIADRSNPSDGWGVFGRAAIADDSANPIAWFLSFGVGGNSPLDSRPSDTFGIGWFYNDTSDQIGPLLQAALGPIGDGQAIELFYNIAVTPWFRLTPDLQWIDSARRRVDDALVAGLRGQIIF
jgi:porin